MKLPFSKIVFGHSSADQEGIRNPELLINGYLDPHGVIREAKTGSKFLFLGYKGSGKSAIGEHLKIISKEDNNSLVTNILLEDFPYSKFKNIVRGDVELEGKLPLAWSWLIFITIINSLKKDTSITSGKINFFNSIVSTLESLELFPSDNWKQIVLKCCKKSFKIVDTSFKEHSIDSFVEDIKCCLASLITKKNHLIVIDGLDDILSKRDIQYVALAALVFTVNKINFFLLKNSISVKVIILCRTDIYEKLPGPNKNKIRQDSSMVLDWYPEPRRGGSSNLIKIANLRASLSCKDRVDIFSTYFHRKIHDEYKNIGLFLLEFTRHTPRDFLQLLKFIQKFSVGEVITRDQLLSGIRSYSYEYFLPEIKDELIGFVDSNQIDLIFGLISLLRSRDFSFADIENVVNEDQNYKKLDIPNVLNLLFECSALGNTHHDKRTAKNILTFKYRNRNSSLMMQDRFILHKAMWKSLNCG
jgi:energy-coupling factor transporter ATP-binding protein EcfA2